MSCNVVLSLTEEPFLVALSRAIVARDRATYEHAARVQQYATALAGQAGIVDTQILDAIHIAALLHDVGKLAIPDQILNKPGPLTSDEYDQVKQHAVIGADILSGVPFPGPLALFVRHHHENWDGTGYPDRRRRTDIPIGARVLSIADCYDALTSDRPYRPALTHDCAIAMIDDRRGSMFDPELTDAFMLIVARVGAASALERPARRQGFTLGPWPIEAGAR